MGNNIIDGTKWLLNGTLIRRIDKYTVEETGEKEPVYAVGMEDEGPMAFRRKPGHWSIEFDYHPEPGKPLIDWYTLGVFTLTEQQIGGARRQYLFCEVSNAGSGEGDAEGTHTAKVTIFARKRKVL
jgi:hypothetical protein